MEPLHPPAPTACRWPMLCPLPPAAQSAAAYGGDGGSAEHIMAQIEKNQEAVESVSAAGSKLVAPVARPLAPLLPSACLPHTPHISNLRLPLCTPLLPAHRC